MHQLSNFSFCIIIYLYYDFWIAYQRDLYIAMCECISDLIGEVRWESWDEACVVLGEAGVMYPGKFLQFQMFLKS